MASSLPLFLACLVHSVAATNNIHGRGAEPAEAAHRRVEIDSNSAIMRRSAPLSHVDESIPAVALDDAEAHHGSATESDSFSVASAQSRYQSSGLAKTLQMLKDKDSMQEKVIGTMVLLVNSSDETEMQDIEANLVPSILTSLKFRTPVTVLFSGPFAPADDATIKMRLNPKITLSLVDVTQRVEQFANEHAPANQKSKGANRWKMEEFWTLHAHMLPELQNYRYAWRLSPKSALSGGVTTDLYQVMKKQKAVFGYRLLQNVKNEACTGIQKAAKSFYEVNAGWKPLSLTAKAFLATFEQAQCPQWTPDFQLVDLDYLRSNEVYGEWAAYLAEKDGFSKHGWSSHSAQAIFLATQLQPEQMLCMTAWVPTYQGESTTSCGPGFDLIKFGQNAFKSSMAQASEALQLKEKVARIPPPILNATNSSANSTMTMVAMSGHAVIISLSVFLAVSMLGGGVAYKKGWVGPSEASIADEAEARASGD